LEMSSSKEASLWRRVAIRNLSFKRESEKQKEKAKEKEDTRESVCV